MKSIDPIQYIDTPNYRFGFWEHCVESSPFPPVIMIHGYPGRPHDFRFLFPLLDNVHCIALAMPNLDITTTKSSVDTTTITARKNAILEFMNHKGISRAFLMGHSMGGPMSTAVTRFHPERILGLVLISAVGAQQYRVFRRSKPRWGHRLINLPVIGNIFKPLVGIIFRSLGFPKGISSDAMFHVLHCANDFSFKENTENMEMLSRPVLNIWSSNDPYVEPELFQEMEEIIPDCERLSFTDGGHNPQRTKAEIVATTFKDWLERHYPSTANRNTETNS